MEPSILQMLSEGLSHLFQDVRTEVKEQSFAQR